MACGGSTCSGSYYSKQSGKGGTLNGTLVNGALTFPGTANAAGTVSGSTVTGTYSGGTFTGSTAGCN